MENISLCYHKAFLTLQTDCCLLRLRRCLLERTSDGTFKKMKYPFKARLNRRIKEPVTGSDIYPGGCVYM